MFDYAEGYKLQPVNIQSLCIRAGRVAEYSKQVTVGVISKWDCDEGILQGEEKKKMNAYHFKHVVMA